MENARGFHMCTTSLYFLSLLWGPKVIWMTILFIDLSLEILPFHLKSSSSELYNLKDNAGWWGGIWQSVRSDDGNRCTGVEVGVIEECCSFLLRRRNLWVPGNLCGGQACVSLQRHSQLIASIFTVKWEARSLMRGKVKRYWALRSKMMWLSHLISCPTQCKNK